VISDRRLAAALALALLDPEGQGMTLAEFVVALHAADAWHGLHYGRSVGIAEHVMRAVGAASAEMLTCLSDSEEQALRIALGLEDEVTDDAGHN